MNRRYAKRMMFLLVALLLTLPPLIFNGSDNKSDNDTTVSDRVATPSSTVAVVSRVVDGDTVEVATGEKVRYIGIDTPESVDPRRKVECFGKEAAKYNQDLVLNKTVSLVRDVGNTDSYQRLLRYVYLEDGTFVNLKLVQEGYALALTIPPNVAFAEEFKQAEQEAREARRGLWGKCK